MGFPSLVGKAKHSRLARWFYPGFAQADKPVLSAAERAVIIDRLRDDIHALEHLLNRDYSSWLSALDEVAESGEVPATTSNPGVHS